MVNFAHLYSSFEVFSRITQMNSSHCRVVGGGSSICWVPSCEGCKQKDVGSSTSIDNYGEYIRGTRSTNANRGPQWTRGAPNQHRGTCPSIKQSTIQPFKCWNAVYCFPSQIYSPKIWRLLQGKTFALCNHYPVCCLFKHQTASLLNMLQTC